MKKCNVLIYFLAFIGFVAAYAIFYWLNGSDLEQEFVDAAAKVPSIRNFGSGTVSTILDIAKKWGTLVSVGLGLIFFLLSLLVLGILKIVRLAKFSIANIFGLFLVYGSGLALAIELLYYEARFTAISIGIIIFIGHPLFYAAITAMSVALAVYLLVMFIGLFRKGGEGDDESSSQKKGRSLTHLGKETAGNVAKFSLIIAAPMFLSGCSLLSAIEGFACVLSPDSSHCYQESAVAAGDPSICEKVKVPKKFAGLGSNPPQDKCYLMVAQNTGNLETCKKIKGGMMSYTQEECIIETSTEHENPSGCNMLQGEARSRCVEKLSPLITPDKALEVDNQIEVLKEELKKGSDPALEAQLKGLEDKRKDMVAVMSKENKAEYNRQSDPLNKEIIGDWAVGDFDSETKNKLISMNERLKANGVTMTKEQYTSVRDYYAYVNNPANDIEQMNDRDLAKDKFGDKVGNLVDKFKFWKTNDTDEENNLDEQLRFYERMLERQKGINQGLSEFQTDFQNTAAQIGDGIGNYVADKAKEKVIEEIFGSITEKTVGLTTQVLGEAIDEVKSQAKSAEFRGLVKAYNGGMQEELAKFGGDVDKAHAEVTKKLSEDPYAYAEGNTFAKYGNLIENNECDGSNPHCLNKNVFWKAMKKSYKYQHKE
jgi:hypothetical protein